jgi:hypothetical protein
MWSDDTLKQHLETSSTIKTKSVVVSEWNLNTPDNIELLGNYRYRPVSRITTDSTYKDLMSKFDSSDVGNFYTNATSADIVFDGGYDNLDIPQVFISSNDKMKQLYSLEDCIKPFRPRSGINKAMYFLGNNFNNFSVASMIQSDAAIQTTINKASYDFVQRPRYYMSSKDDVFKYWTSYRTENNQDRGIANIIYQSSNYIDDTAPFVVYKENIFANRLTVKVQTNTGSSDLGPFIANGVSIADPLYGTANMTVPVKWQIQVLKENNTWKSIKSFDENSKKLDGSNIFNSDGHLELSYGLKIPQKYKDNFIYMGKLANKNLLPDVARPGFAWLVSNGSRGSIYIWNVLTSTYDIFSAEYGWEISDEKLYDKTHFVRTLVDPDFFIESSETTYREVEEIRGIRIVVDTMNKFDSTFDLIEMSPRLAANISDYVLDYSVTKSLADLNNISIPVGQLLASTGSLQILDYDNAFNNNNSKSLISNYVGKNIKIIFYEGIIDVGGYNYYIPVKTLYSDAVPKMDISNGKITLDLRDFFFYLESNTAPELLLTNVSLSYAISILLDGIGFSNYVFRRTSGEVDPVIPYFFVAPNQNVAEVLNQLALATQTAMFFDEYNNLVIMSKNFMTPSQTDRATNMELIGSDRSDKQSNILELSSVDKKVFNNGRINYTERYIQRSYSSIKQSTLVDQDKTWVYKPALLWEVSGTENTKSVNAKASNMGSYVLGAYPLNNELTINPPTVVERVLQNNIINFGENIYWITRYQGYVYANGEIIRYDAVQFSVPGYGNIWISDNEEYQKYFSNISFNGKIYPTGLVRIYSEPYYETVNGITMMKNGAVAKHGRAQFGTNITYHPAGLPTYWSDNNNVRGCNMDSNYLFGTQTTTSYPATQVGPAGISNEKAKGSYRNGIIRNFMSSNYRTETEVNKLNTTGIGTLQSSALVITGPTYDVGENPIDNISYVYKSLSPSGTAVDGVVTAQTAKYKHFGTRLRVIGKIEVGDQQGQTAIGSTPYYSLPSTTASQNLTISGGGGGVAVLLNPSTNIGYYFEVNALTETNISSYLKNDSNGDPLINLNNIVFYKIKQQTGTTKAVPIKLWGGIANILVDDGKFTGQYRVNGEANPTVYDLAVEYSDISSTHRKFYLYINNNLVSVVDDYDPLPAYNNMALFVRGSSRLMFENIYALSQNYSSSTVFDATKVIADVFGDKQINATEALRKYAVSGMVQASYLSEISAQTPPGYSMYFEEFGTIMREAAYFNIKYDKAWPALYAKLSPTFNMIKSYVVSGFTANAYGAEFLIFNSTDSAINLDETTGNYLRIQGITFTQDTTHELSVDKFFEKKANFADPELSGTKVLRSPEILDEKFNEIKLSRMTYGNSDFTIDSPYIQTQDHAENIMAWIVDKVMKPKKNVGIKLFSNPMLQLGDIVTIDYSKNGLDLVASKDTRYIVYNISYQKGVGGPDMNVYLCEI